MGARFGGPTLSGPARLALLAAALLATPALAAIPLDPSWEVEGDRDDAPAIRRHSAEGRAEVVPTFGFVAFDRALAIQNDLSYGAELNHHFRVDHPLVIPGVYVGVTGVLSETVLTRRKVDVIYGSGGTTFAFRGLDHFLPVVRAGAGFILADGRSGGFDVVGRLAFEVGGGIRYYPVEWIVVRAELRVMVHDNLLTGTGSGQLRDVVHWMPTSGVGIAL